MGGVSADGKVLWLSGRYSREVYAFDTTGRAFAGANPRGQGPARPLRLSPAWPVFAGPYWYSFR